MSFNGNLKPLMRVSGDEGGKFSERYTGWHSREVVEWVYNNWQMGITASVLSKLAMRRQEMWISPRDVEDILLALGCYIVPSEVYRGPRTWRRAVKARPIELGGSRDVWLEYRPGPDPRFNFMEPVRRDG